MASMGSVTYSSEPEEMSDSDSEFVTSAPIAPTPTTSRIRMTTRIRTTPIPTPVFSPTTVDTHVVLETTPVPTEDIAPKRKRGRPRKHPLTATTDISAPKRGRGRPRKHPFVATGTPLPRIDDEPVPLHEEVPGLKEFVKDPMIEYLKQADGFLRARFTTDVEFEDYKDFIAKGREETDEEIYRLMATNKRLEEELKETKKSLERHEDMITILMDIVTTLGPKPPTPPV